MYNKKIQFSSTSLFINLNDHSVVRSSSFFANLYEAYIPRHSWIASIIKKIIRLQMKNLASFFPASYYFGCLKWIKIITAISIQSSTKSSGTTKPITCKDAFRFRCFFPSPVFFYRAKRAEYRRETLAESGRLCCIEKIVFSRLASDFLPSLWVEKNRATGVYLQRRIRDPVPSAHTQIQWWIT